MNYLSEILAFYDWLETNPLPSPAIVTWHALMSIANKTGWKQEFAVAVSVISLKTGLNAKAIERARNKLAQDGRIRWKPRGGNKSAIYEMISLCDKTDSENVAQDVGEDVVQSVAQSVSQGVAINKTKQNKTKQNNKKDKKKESLKYSDDPELESAIMDFIDMRRKIKAPMTDKAIKLLLSRLDKMTDQNSVKAMILEQSIVNSWKSVYPLKTEGDNNSSNRGNKQFKRSADEFRNSPERAYEEDDFDRMEREMNGL